MTAEQVTAANFSALYEPTFISGRRSTAFCARLEYERNCIEKYDRPGSPSYTPPIGERMLDYAEKFGCTLSEMKDVLPEVEKYLGLGR